MVAYTRKPRVPMTKAMAKKRIAAAIRKKRMNNKPVKRAYFRKGVTKNSNYSAITTLARQVKQLQFQRNGFKQWHHVHANTLATYDPAVPATVRQERMRPLIDRPYAFMVNDFTPQAKVFFGVPAPGLPNVPSYLESQQFDVTSTNTGLLDNYNWNLKQGQDTCLSTHYLPIKSTMRFEVLCTSTGPTETPIKVRISMIKMKNYGTQNISAALPQNLYAYKNLVTNDVRSRNQFNTAEYHTVLQEKWLHFKQTDVTKTNDRRFVTIRYNNYSTKPLNPDVSPSPAGQSIPFTVDKKDQVWIIVSTDCTDENRLYISCARWNTWRDAQGVGS